MAKMLFMLAPDTPRVGSPTTSAKRDADETFDAEGPAEAEILRELRVMIEAWRGIKVVTHYDRPTGSWFFIALHDATLGMPVGGCRMAAYPTAADGLRDAMRLAEGMTHKWAAINFGHGGGKSVIAVPSPLTGDERSGVFRRFGELVESLDGLYSTGQDLGTNSDDMAVIAGMTRYVHGIDAATGNHIDSGHYTALGVLAGIEASLKHVFGSGEMRGRRIFVQGVGSVGGALARMLSKAGAEVAISEADETRAREYAGALNVELVPTEKMYAAACDVYAPCAMGGTLNSQSVPLLTCRIVAGAANNQLQCSEVADQLDRRGILYAPDYVVNAGGAIALSMLHRGATGAEVHARIEDIAGTLGGIFAEAAERQESPARAARRRVERIIAGTH
ncbi:MAG: Glu/Leu/Phe/Val dehydrogenase dimerization domain-containing protein [Pyrinomonadaceae bacterium]